MVGVFWKLRFRFCNSDRYIDDFVFGYYLVMVVLRGFGACDFVCLCLVGGGFDI